MKPIAPLPQEGGSYIRNADGSLRASDAPPPDVPEPATPAPPEADTTTEPAPPSRRAPKQPVKES